MPQFTLAQRAFILEHYFRTLSYAKVIEKFRDKFTDASLPNKTSIYRLVKKFRTTFSLENDKGKRTSYVVTPEKISEIRDKITTRKNLSIRKLSRQVKMSRMSVQRSLKRLQLKPYRVMMHQELKLTDCPKREKFCRWLLSKRLKNGMEFLDNFFFSDEAWFHLDGYVNSQIYRIWSAENPYAYRETRLHPKKIGVWCAESLGLAS
jgi:transposase